MVRNAEAVGSAVAAAVAAVAKATVTVPMVAAAAARTAAALKQNTPALPPSLETQPMVEAAVASTSASSSTTPPAHQTPPLLPSAGTRAGKEIKFSKCGLRVGTKFKNHTAGTLWLLCSCGCMFPAMELPDSESTRMVMYYLIKCFTDQPYVQSSRGATQMIISFDDHCHLLRWAKKQLHNHPDIKRFVEETIHVVDKFHFQKNHKGAWCDLNTNPYKVKALMDGRTNMSVCEQRFKHVGKYSGTFRQLGEERFAAMIQIVSGMDHLMRDLGLL